MSFVSSSLKRYQ